MGQYVKPSEEKAYSHDSLTGKNASSVKGERRMSLSRLCFSFSEASRRLVYAALCLMVLVALSLVLTLTFGYDELFAEPDIPVQLPESGPYITTFGSHPFADGKEGDVSIPFNEKADIIPEDMLSAQRAALVDMTSGTVIASRLADERMYPASMTKIMTLIVTAENMPEEESLSHVITIRQETYDAMKAEGASGIGLEPGEELTVESLLYILILRSDGVAACELATFIAGSEQAFVSLMNRKADAMGLSNTHFANVTGLQDEANYSTCRDIAALMAYAMDMSLCRRILTATSYQASCTATKGENAGKTFTYYVSNNLLVTLLTDKYPSYMANGVIIQAGKTGYAGKESGYCLVTYAVTKDQRAYICVTSHSDSYLDCIKDYITIYNAYT